MGNETRSESVWIVLSRMGACSVQDFGAYQQSTTYCCVILAIRPPLTPNHFLIGRGDLQSPDVPCEQYHGDFRKLRDLCNVMVDKFWMIFFSLLSSFLIFFLLHRLC